MEEKNKQINNSKIVWIILSVIVVLLIAGIGSVYATNYLKTKATSISAEEGNQLEQENVKETAKLEDLEDVSKLTEEELKKLNDNEIITVILNEEKDQKENEKPTTTTQKARNKYYIKVNYGAQIVDVYTYDSNGKYTKLVKTFICSTGTETPRSGVYRIPAKITWLYMFGDVYGHYCTQIVGNILFHSVPYLTKYDNSTLEYWEYDKLGTKASMGCVRMTTADALWIFNNVSIGTQVEFYSDSSQAYRRPTAQKISDAPENIRGWDPTDPDPNNPWKTYKPEKPVKPEGDNTTPENGGQDNENTNNGENNTEGNNPDNKNDTEGDKIESDGSGTDTEGSKPGDESNSDNFEENKKDEETSSGNETIGDKADSGEETEESQNPEGGNAEDNGSESKSGAQDITQTESNDQNDELQIEKKIPKN